ncbi:MAG: hypothetical protein GOP50_11630 [Candidatus Heimdallarchaeota archaeon]|nr:hypothetical protein [Candidatus Heimdallarchaeota archaeon]
MIGNTTSSSHSSATENNLQIGMSERDEEWHRLENAATGFSLIASPRVPQVFRLAVTLKEPINTTILQRALNRIIVRFPFFRINLKTGFFWHFWETNMSFPKIMRDTKYPNEFMPITQKGVFPFRVKVYKRRIAVEFHHCLTDGTGGKTFLKALLGEYLSLKGVKVKDWKDILRPDQTPILEEYEDAYRRFDKKIKVSRKLDAKAFRLPFKRMKIGKYHITKGIMPVKQVLEKAKELKISLTEYIAAILIESLHELVFSFPENLRRKHIRPIRVMIPVNLRNIYPSKTMRNFSLYVTPGIDPRLGYYSFEEIVKQVHHYMKKEVNPKYFMTHIHKNVENENMLFLRLTPLMVKKFFGQKGYFRIGTTLYSTVLTNLGKITVPEELEEYIEEFEFVPAQVPVNKVGTAMVSYKDKLIINFGRIIEEPVFERIFFRNLVKKGIEVKIQTN